MITVRFSNGFSIQYNEGWYCDFSSPAGTCIYDMPEGKLIAKVPLDAVIEWVPACRTYNAGSDDALALVRELTRTIDGLRRDVARLRKEKAK